MAYILYFSYFHASSTIRPVVGCLGVVLGRVCVTSYISDDLLIQELQLQHVIASCTVIHRSRGSLDDDEDTGDKPSSFNWYI